MDPTPTPANTPVGTASPWACAHSFTCPRRAPWPIVTLAVAGSHRVEFIRAKWMRTAVAHAELGVAAAAQRHGHAVAVVFGGTPEAALDPGGDEADREDHVAFARGLERARGSPALVKARVIRARRGREAGVVSGRVRQVHAALGAEIPEVRRDEVLERSHGDRGREVAGAVKGRWRAKEVRVVRMCVVQRFQHPGKTPNKNEYALLDWL